MAFTRKLQVQRPNTGLYDEVTPRPDAPSSQATAYTYVTNMVIYTEHGTCGGMCVIEIPACTIDGQLGGTDSWEELYM